MRIWNKGLCVAALSVLLMACDNNTPLMEKVIEEDAAAVELMLAQGNDIEARNNYGWTALMHAARQDS